MFTIALISGEGPNYSVSSTANSGIVVANPPTVAGGDHRLAILQSTVAPLSVNQQVCITWHGPRNTSIQPGLTLRVRTETRRTRAIMITDNVWLGARFLVNMHLVDTNTPGVLKAVGSVDLTTAVGPMTTRAEPLPWGMCARVTGTAVDVKLWPRADRRSEPAWDDPTYVRRMSVPTTWVVPGRPGAYVGHLQVGETTRFSHFSFTSLPDADVDGRG